MVQFLTQLDVCECDQCIDGVIMKCRPDGTVLTQLDVCGCDQCIDGAIIK